MPEEQLSAEIEWEGIDIEVRFTRNWLNGTAHHIELRADEPLSVTLTGYRSHFIPSDQEIDFCYVFAFVAEWLDEAARCRSWQDHVERTRQGELFDL